jgi:hypothetical protein
VGGVLLQSPRTQNISYFNVRITDSDRRRSAGDATSVLNTIDDDIIHRSLSSTTPSCFAILQDNRSCVVARICCAATRHSLLPFCTTPTSSPRWANLSIARLQLALSVYLCTRLRRRRFFSYGLDETFARGLGHCEDCPLGKARIQTLQLL